MRGYLLERPQECLACFVHLMRLSRRDESLLGREPPVVLRLLRPGFFSGIRPTNCFIGEPLTDHTIESNDGAGFIIHAQSNPVVIAEIVLAQIAVQVLFLTVLVSMSQGGIRKSCSSI
jgi:hypothetical protein